jgi:hypothetical protein
MIKKITLKPVEQPVRIKRVYAVFRDGERIGFVVRQHKSEPWDAYNVNDNHIGAFPDPAGKAKALHAVIKAAR